MTPANKPEFPPLLPAGLHTMSATDLQILCVTKFPSSKTRDLIMNGLEQIFALLESAQVSCEVWIDGSFMTGKLDPEDADIVLCVQSEVYDKGNVEQRRTIDFINTNLKQVFHCDSYVFVEYPRSHPLYTIGQGMRTYWKKQFGFSRGNEVKGLAVVKVGGCL